MLKIAQLPFPLWLTGIVLLGAIAPLPALAQRAAGDIVIIGNSPAAWSRNQRYWNHLLNLSSATAAPSAPTTAGAPQEVDPKALEQQLLRNIRVGQPQLQPVLKLPGSSVVTGTVTNNNRQPVTIQAINYEVVGANGELLQTGAATPEPATVAPGQTVTYQKMLPNVPADIGAQVRLSQPAVVLQGGV
ncbi:FxLYD domain-containing protein [uncultured Thermosynechococcus sp.]|uniref:FxLYD domain-containing protein n=1 Tax=uncultured Thermosynechococcus sp. TaxID=436945 RepID=UPI002633AF4E|nr:FxLYD domain-containing protein [uncultured Thermosynechococcus sp.]